MKLLITPHTFKKSSVKRVVDAVIEELTRYEEQGFSVTLRQLFYRLVALGTLVNRVLDYKYLGRYINRAKEAGIIDWNWVEDRTRFLRGRQRYLSTSELLADAAQGWHMDFWAGQPTRPELWIEKDALLSIIAPVCREYDVNYYSLRGWGTPTDKFHATQRFLDYAAEGQATRLLHGGDHDPTGCWVTRNIEAQLKKYQAELSPGDGSIVEVRRIALTKEQIARLSLPPNKIGDDPGEDKSKESRWKEYVAENGGCADTWELDALDPNVLQDIVRTAIKECITDQEAWDQRQEEIRRGAEELAAIIEGGA